MNKEGKITKAKNDKVARENALAEMTMTENFKKVGNWNFAITVPNAEGKDTVVRVDIVVPKVEAGVSAEDMAMEFETEKEIKEAEAKAIKEAKEKTKANKVK